MTCLVVRKKSNYQSKNFWLNTETKFELCSIVVLNHLANQSNTCYLSL